MNHVALKAIVFAGLIASQVSIISAPASTLSTNADWTWMKGTNIIDQPGAYGTQGVPTPTNTPGARRGAVSWTDGSGALWLFGGRGYPTAGLPGHLNDLWKFDPATTNWTWMKGANTTNQPGTYGEQGVPATNNTPGARIWAASWTDASGALWLFGGYDADNSDDFNDLWKFDPVTTNWTWIKGANVTNQNGTYGTQGVPAATNTPGARDSTASWIDGSGALWLFGGWGFAASGGAPGNLNDLWKFDPTTTNWTWMKGSTNLAAFGTYGEQGVPAATNTPGARDSAISWTDEGVLWLFGGVGLAASGGNGYLNDLWKYDPTTTNWTWIKGTNIINQKGTYGDQGVPAATNTPGAREDIVSWIDGSGTLWLFGGIGYDALGIVGELNDLWKYNPATTNWIWMKGATNVNQLGTYGEQGVPDSANTPGGREEATSWTDGAGALWLFGGYGYPASGGIGFLNDLWKFDVGGVISLTTNVLVFSATAGAANPAAQMVGMTNVGVDVFTYTNVITYSAGASGWLTVSPAAGTVASNGATILTNQVNISGLGAGTYYATNKVTADAKNNPQTVVVKLTVIGLADFVVVDNSGWRIWCSSVGYEMFGPIMLGVSGTPLAADFDGDCLADFAVVDETGDWYLWCSGAGYAPSGPRVLDVTGTPLAGDFDGDGLADFVVVDYASWYIWCSSANYEMFTVVLGRSGTPVASDFDGDRFADFVVVDHTNWYIYCSSAGYEMFTIVLGRSGTPLAADFDGDGLADFVVVDNTSWRIWCSSVGYEMFTIVLGVSGTPLAADFDGQ